MKLNFSLFFLSVTLSVAAQEKPKVKFGDVTAKDFETKVYAIDSNAQAVVLSDIGYSTIEGNSKGWFSLIFKQHKRIHILNKSAYDLADVSIYLHSDDDDEEVLEKLRATTYNLIDGKVVETKLDLKTGVFKDKLDKTNLVKKFTLPNVKEGCIIEYEYTVKSDYLQYLRPWEFQGGYPRLWSEYNLSLPDFLGYVFLTQGYRDFDISTRKTSTEIYRVADSRGIGATEFINLSSGVTNYRWAIKDVQALKEESFTSTLDNHISKIEFQLSEFRHPLAERKIMGTWPKLSEDLMKNEFFGEAIGKENSWLKDDIAPIVKGAVSKRDKALKIFEYVRDNFTCTDHSDLFMGQTMKNLVKTKNGTVSEINLLLTAMLRYADVEADPVILSTRSNGYTYAIYPLLGQYNYVVTRAVADGKPYFLDASEPFLGYGYLPLRCYNGHARVINEEATAIELISDSLREKKMTTIFMINDEKGQMVGSLNQTPGYYESFNLRKRIKEKGKEQLLADIKKDFGTEIEISNFQLDSLAKHEEIVGIRYDFELKSEQEDIIYLNPMFGEEMKENPFKSAERFYPVEMPYTFDETFNLQMDVPPGYVIDELPKSLVVKLNEENEGFFEYRISQSGNAISFRSRVKIDRTFFQPAEYDMLREFFNLVVKKQAEQIVFKKKG
jgi:Domain of Unknown Function with PDB structure (DUF3857)/Transglutaminase-like superfamily